jgi:hypothetical protein
MSKLDTSALRGWQFITSSGKITMFIYTSSTNYIRKETNSTYNDGAWHHVVMTYSGNGLASGITIYVDGSPVAMTVTQDNLGGGTIVNSYQMQLATRNATYFLAGNLDEIVVYDTALIAANVTERYNAGSGTELPIGSYSVANPAIETKTGFAYIDVWSLFEEVIVVPATTGIRYVLSADNGVTYLYWNGSAWAVSSGYAQSNAGVDVNTNIGTFPTIGTLKVKAYLHSDFGLATPQLDDIKFTGGITYPVGSFEIAMVGDITPADILSFIDVVETVTKPADTNVLYKHSENSGWSYNAAWLTAAQLKAELIVLPSPTKTRIKVQLSTTVSYSTPEIDNLQITSYLGQYRTASYESNVYDASYYNLDWGKIAYSMAVATGAAVQIKARASDYLADMGSYGAALTNGEQTHVVGRYVQWKAEIETDGYANIVLDDLGIEYDSPVMQEIKP